MTEDRADSLAFQQLADEVIAKGLSFRFEARGESMFPTVRDGEILHVRPAGRSRLKAGDMVLFRTDGKFKAHRIIRKQGQFLVTRGDASLDADHLITTQQIVGTVIAKECRQTGFVTSMNSAVAHVRFFGEELRRMLSRRLKSLRRQWTPKWPTLP
jgi:peptidase S24-like protein